MWEFSSKMDAQSGAVFLSGRLGFCPVMEIFGLNVILLGGA